jgi:tight adherence protein B
MLAAIVVFFLGSGGVLAAFKLWERLGARMAERRLKDRLRDVGQMVAVEPGETTVIKQTHEGPLPAIERVVARTPAGPKLTRLIEQSGKQTTPSVVILASFASALLLWLIAGRFVYIPFVRSIIAGAGFSLPTVFLMRCRTLRIRRFEEQFPEALDLLSRAMRAGHAFQTALGTAAEELHEPVGVELKKVFDQQNFGLPLNDALKELAERIPLVDVKFFVTAIAIQRESGGNLAEILDNLAHVVRERFKVLRQVRTHTAHGRFTGFVLLALPAALAVGLSFVAPDMMDLLFKEPMGKMMIAGAMVAQTIGFFWIRKVIKIEV